MTVRVEIFSVSSDTAQLIVRGAFGDVALRSASGSTYAPIQQTRLDLPVRTRLGKVTAVRGDHLAAADFGGLTSDNEHSILIDGVPRGTLQTLARPPGALVGRLATLSDLHVGQRRNGRFPRVPVLAESGPVDHHAGHSMACLRAAVNEIATWNPDVVIVKGDIAHTNAAEEYDLAFGEISRLPCPQIVTAGNHDGGDYQASDFTAEASRLGYPSEPVQICDIGTWRIIVADTVVAGKRTGTLADTGAAILDACAEWDGPCLLTLHHQLMARPIPHYVPTGVPSAEARPFLDRLATANPRTLVTSGHTHRHRVRHAGPIVVTEVGSTKDYPGSWAGYELYEGGITQIVRRIADPEALMWNERTRQAAFGIWGKWAPGQLTDRCFSHVW